jgi:hypothetical protein
MNFCSFGSDFQKNGYTPVDNVFLEGYLPAADATDVKVYLYGLHLAYLGDLPDNSIEHIAFSLRLSEERVIAAFRYWEDQGIVSISKTHPVHIVYGSVRQPITPVIKYNAREYSTFVEEMARLFPDTVLHPNEINAYLEALRTYKMDINAMLMIVKYCMDYRGVASTPYILAVADNWARQGITTEAEVTEHIEELECSSDDIRSIFKALNMRSLPSIEDRQLYLKWTKEYGFQMDAILTAARFCKRRGGMHKLEQVIEELRKAGVTTAQEVDAFAKSKESARKLAEDIVSGIGSFYANVDVVVETYILPWLSKGFEDDALRAIAKYCFLRNVRTLDGVNDIVERFYHLGFLTAERIESFIARQMSIDAQIKEVLSAANVTANVTNRDREFYRTFAEVWGFPQQTILLAAARAAGKAFPMSEINRTLALLKERGIRDAEEAESFLNALSQPSAKSAAPRDDYQKQTYTKEQLDSVFVNPGEIDLDKLDF